MASLDYSRSRGFRIKVDLSELVCGGLSRCWFFVDPSVCKTIADLQRVISARFSLQCPASDFEVRLQNFMIPRDESVDVLQADDLLVLRRLFPRQCSPQKLNCMGEHGAMPHLPSFQVAPECCKCCEHDAEKRPLESIGSKTIEDDEDQTPSTSIEPCSSPAKQKKKKKSKELPAPIVIPEVTKKSKKRSGQHNHESGEKLVAKKNAEHLLETPKSHSKKSKKSKTLVMSNSSLIQESPKKKKRGSAGLGIECENTGSKNRTEQSPKSPEADGIDDDLALKDMPKKKRKRNRKSKCKNANTMHSDVSMCGAEDVAGSTPNDHTPRISQLAFNFGSETSAKHFRFDGENAQECSDSSENLNEQALLPHKSPGVDSSTWHDMRSEEPHLADPDTIQRNGVETDAKSKSPSRALAANIPNLKKNPDVAVEANEVRAIDYSQYPALIGHPRVKDVVAYKVLELTEDYMPKVSDYLVGEVISSDPSTKEVTIQFLTPIKTKARRGKFELIEQDMEEEIEPEEETITNVTVEWHFVMDAKLIPNGGPLN